MGRDLETEEGVRMALDAALNVKLGAGVRASGRGLPSIRSQSLCKPCMGQSSHSWMGVLLLCKAAAVEKACFKVSITSSTCHERSVQTHTHTQKDIK